MRLASNTPPNQRKLSLAAYTNGTVVGVIAVIVLALSALAWEYRGSIVKTKAATTGTAHSSGVVPEAAHEEHHKHSKKGKKKEHEDKAESVSSAKGHK